MRAVVSIIILLTVGCDRSYKVALQPINKTRQVQIEPLAQLSANLLTHVVVDRQKNLYWSQETAAGQDVMFVMGSGDMSRATDLTSGRILAMLDGAVGDRKVGDRSAGDRNTGDHATGERRGGRAGGNIQSLALGPDGKIYFYFSGSNGRAVRVALGTFDPLTGVFRILADSDALMSTTRMDQSIALARGKLIVTGRLVRLFIRHTDSWVLLDYDPRKLMLAEQLAQQDRPPLLVRTITRISTQDKNGQPVPIDMTADGIDLFAGPEAANDSTTAAKFLVMDKKLGAIDLVNDSGDAKLLASLVELPKALSAPLIDTTSSEQKRIVFCAAESDRLDPLNGERPDPAPVQVAYPAILSLGATDGAYMAIGRENFHGPGEFAVYAVQLQQLVQFGQDVCAGYDRSSGQMLRIRLTD